MHRLKRSASAAVALSATTLLALPVGSADAQAGLSACDHAASYRGIPCSEVDRAVAEAAREFRVDEGRLRQIVRCESRFDPFAGGSLYKGLFQQSTSHWSGRAADFNAHEDPDVPGNIENPFDNARVSARMLALQGDSAWPSC